LQIGKGCKGTNVNRDGGPNDAKEAIDIAPIYPYFASMNNKTLSETRTMHLKARNVNTCQGRGNLD
jgi:hypothetical protein